eukprot:scaffold70920_cov69-Phaeocystis_antarctica.AAC.5
MSETRERDPGCAGAGAGRASRVAHLTRRTRQSLPLTSCQEDPPPPGPGLCGPVLWLIFNQFGRTRSWKAYE